MARSYYSQIERGEILNPRLETADRVLRALGLDLTLGAVPSNRSATSLAYDSPFSIESSGMGARSAQSSSAIRMLQDALKNDDIPPFQKRLLEQQVRALVAVVVAGHTRQEGDE